MFGFGAKNRPVLTDEDTVRELLTRGVENVIPRDLAEKKLTSGEPIRVYLGIDPTGAKLHLGHSVVLRKLKAFSDAGHHVVFLVGNFTAMIGDPTGRDAAREPLTPEKVEENFADYKRQAEKILDFSRAEIRHNADWLAPLTFSEIIKLASNFTVQQMLQRDMFEKRIGEGKPISLHEFLYPLMVGYDSVVLDVDCEMGGSDQEFNMLAGRQLQKAMQKREKFVLTTKLIEGTDGRKMSKTYNNCVYLDDEPSDMYGKIMSVKDELVATYFECVTNVPREDIPNILSGHPKEAKMRLAKEIVTMYHGEDAAQYAEQHFTHAFSEGGVPENAPEVFVEKGAPLHSALVSVVESKSEMRRLADAGAIGEVGGESFADISMPIERDMTLRIGKHRFLKITIQ